MIAGGGSSFIGSYSGFMDGCNFAVVVGMYEVCIVCGVGGSSIPSVVSSSATVSTITVPPHLSCIGSFVSNFVRTVLSS